MARDKQTMYGHMTDGRPMAEGQTDFSWQFCKRPRRYCCDQKNNLSHGLTRVAGTV